MSTMTWVRETLKRKGVPFEELHHAEAFTAQEVAQREHYSGDRVAKVVVAIADGKPIELVMPATHRVVMDELRKLVPAKELRLATEAEMERFFTDTEVGATPPLRHWPDVEVLMDESMKMDGEILFQAGTHADAVRMRYQDWFELVRPRTGTFTTRSNVVGGREPSPRPGEFCANPVELQRLLSDLLDILHLQAKEIERLTTHVERHTDRLLSESQLPLVTSELSALRTRLKT